MNVREQALEQCKLGGNPTIALALALVYIGDSLDDNTDVADGLRTVAVELRHISGAIRASG